MRQNKIANVEKATDKTVNLIIMIIVIFNLVGTTAASIIAAANNISTGVNVSGNFVQLPLASLFGAGGVVLTIFMVGLLKMVLSSSKTGK
jgi:hypothetical protein